MEQSIANQPDFGTGHKKLSVYLVGLINCVILTIISFWVVISQHFSKSEILIIIYTAALVQFLVQVICFLRLNIQTNQSKINVMSILFTLVILITIVMGSLWIMWNLNYQMMH